jgi:hypothetical protein
MLFSFFSFFFSRFLLGLVLDTAGAGQDEGWFSFVFIRNFRNVSMEFCVSRVSSSHL